MVQPTLIGGGVGGLTIKLCDKAVQNMYNCAFPIFSGIFQKLWIFHQEKLRDALQERKETILLQYDSNITYHFVSSCLIFFSHE